MASLVFRSVFPHVCVVWGCVRVRFDVVFVVLQLYRWPGWSWAVVSTGRTPRTPRWAPPSPTGPSHFRWRTGWWEGGGRTVCRGSWDCRATLTHTNTQTHTRTKGLNDNHHFVPSVRGAAVTGSQLLTSQFTTNPLKKQNPSHECVRAMNSETIHSLCQLHICLLWCGRLKHVQQR